MYFAEQNGRVITKNDRIFAISGRAKEAIAKYGKEAVTDATIGALIDDEGNLIVLSSVAEAFKNLKPEQFAAYAPIHGLPGYRDALIKDALCGYEPKRFCDATSTPGGTGAVRNTIANYSKFGDRILIADWYWAPYKTIAQEIGREVETFTWFDDENKFNFASFEEKLTLLFEKQDGVVVILNTPANNPTGYTVTDGDWQRITKIFEKTAEGKKLTLLIDTAYIDFAGDSKEYRSFLPIVDEMPENVMVVIAHSLSKAYTMYGLRAGGVVCLASTKDEAEEFATVTALSSRGSWSNCARAPQEILVQVYSNPELKKRVDEERAYYREMLIRRGRALEEEAKKLGIEMVPFDAGFFASFPCDNPEEISQELEKNNIFVVPLVKGLRVAVAAISEEKCRRIPQAIADAYRKSAK